MGFKLLIGPKKLGVASPTLIDARIESIPIFAGKGALGPLFPQNVKLLRGEHFSPILFRFLKGLIILVGHVPILAHSTYDL
jgi:hypothetical protein